MALEIEVGDPTIVTTVRFVFAPGATSKMVTLSTLLITSTMLSILSRSLPSEKLGTHSINLFIR